MNEIDTIQKQIHDCDCYNREEFCSTCRRLHNRWMALLDQQFESDE